MRQFLVAAFLTAICAAGVFPFDIKPDLIVFNANVRTLDRSRPTAQAFAVLNGRIVAIGTTAEIKLLAGPKTERIDAGGKLVIPGFNDAHVHFLDGGAGLSSVDLRDAKTPAEFVERIRRFAATLPKGRWIQNGNWDHENWTPNDLPTAAMIDAVTPDNPVFINRLDGHMSLANSLAMKLAGVDRNTKEVAGGEIVRDKDGNPTGVFKDEAMGYINRVIPAFSYAERVDYLTAATNYAASLGVTSVQDMSAGTDIGVLQDLARNGKLKTRVYAVSPLGDWRRWSNTGVTRAFGDPLLRVGGLKGFADGSLGSTTAWFYEPYLDKPDSRGLAIEDPERTYGYVSAADKAGLQVMIHAIGDRANDEIVKIYEKVAKENGPRDRRFRIEHSQHLNDGLIKRFAAANVIASMQPFHVIDDGRWAWKRLDQKRLNGTYAFRTLLASGARLAFGTDWFVAPLNPMFGIYAAVTRRTLDDKNPNGWIPEQKISVEEALRAYTEGSAYAEFQENEKGTLAVGKLADFVVLSNDIFKIDPNAIGQVKVLRTVMNGRTVFKLR
ncbi:MAG: amidohydrolase [Acidobacteria bacterium]|nr:amidohydrolase [Acidobacteriota bacterium]